MLALILLFSISCFGSNISFVIEADKSIKKSRFFQEMNLSPSFLNKNSIPELSNYYRINFAANKRSEVVRELKRNRSIKSFYENPTFENPSESLDVESIFPAFDQRQWYLENNFGGLYAKWAKDNFKNLGANLTVVDIEAGWNLNHIEFKDIKNINGINDLYYEKHGTAVLGILGGSNDGKGIDGIITNANLAVAGYDLSEENWEHSLSRAIEASVEALSKGDVLLIESHAKGPDLGAFAPVEYWNEVFQITKVATKKGIHVIAAAGNGYSNLDSKKYNGAFDIEIRDSGSILVGAAGAPNTLNFMEKLFFSNFGDRVDAFGYGKFVVTSGYGDLYFIPGGINETYTRKFNGTSSAAPMVAGAVAIISSIAKSKGREITPKEMRAAIRKTGDSQIGSNQDQNIGSFPNIQRLYSYFFGDL